MRHPFDGMADPGRRTALWQMLAVAGGAAATPVLAGGDPNSTLTTEAVGEEGGRRPIMVTSNAFNEEGGVSSRSLEEEGGMPTSRNGEAGHQLEIPSPPMPEPEADLTPAELEQAWAELASTDPNIAFASIHRLLTARQTVSFLRPLLKAAGALPAPAAVARWIAALDAPTFAARQAATTALAEMGPTVEPALRKAIEARPPLEVLRRLETLLEKCVTRRQQVVSALDVVLLHKAGDLGLVATLAEGAEGHWLTQHARQHCANLRLLCWQQRNPAVKVTVRDQLMTRPAR